MRRRDIQANDAPPMDDEAAAILLDGFAATPPAPPDPPGSIFWLFTERDLGAVWRQYERFLRARAQAWGWAPQCWIRPANEYKLRFVVGERGERNDGPYFYAEALAIAGPQRVDGLVR